MPEKPKFTPEELKKMADRAEELARRAREWVERQRKKEKKGEVIGMEVIPEAVVKVGGAVRSCDISPDGKFAIIGSSDKT
ncbi:hypothetical protein J7L13_03855, partial [bacterium]|nr:hypothetical protein [bacterium]